MPTYVYECSKCGEELEVWQSMSEDSLTRHPKCGGKLTKVLQPVGILLKGSGFYRNDSRSGTGSTKSGGNGHSSGSGSGDTGSGGGSSGSTESSSSPGSGSGAGSGTKDAAPKAPASDHHH